MRQRFLWAALVLDLLLIPLSVLIIPFSRPLAIAIMFAAMAPATLTIGLVLLYLRRNRHVEGYNPGWVTSLGIGISLFGYVIVLGIWMAALNSSLQKNDISIVLQWYFEMYVPWYLVTALTCVGVRNQLARVRSSAQPPHTPDTHHHPHPSAQPYAAHHR